MIYISRNIGSMSSIENPIDLSSSKSVEEESVNLKP